VGTTGRTNIYARLSNKFANVFAVSKEKLTMFPFLSFQTRFADFFLNFRPKQQSLPKEFLFCKEKEEQFFVHVFFLPTVEECKLFVMFSGDVPRIFETWIYENQRVRSRCRSTTLAVCFISISVK